jgi:hypothetical protein
MSKATSIKQAREMTLEQYRDCAAMYTFYREQAVSNELVFAPLTPESCKERAERYCAQLLALGDVLEGVFGVSYDTLLGIELEESRKNRAILQAAKG